MSWEDRLQQAAYRSAVTNTRTVLTYEDVSRVVEKKTSAYDFPNADGSYVRDRGHKSRRYPLRLFFNGEDHDTQADAFERTLLERGTGVLEHPRYGTVNVVPFGEITQRDDLKTAAAQTVIEVVFWATIDDLYPASQVSGVAETIAAVDSFKEAAAEQVEDAVILDTALEETTLRDQWASFVNAANSAFAPVLATSTQVTRAYATVSTSITNGLGLLIGAPLTLAAQTITLINLPAQSAALISDRLDAYASLVSSMLNSSGSRIPTGQATEPSNIAQTRDGQANNQLVAREIFAQAAVAGTVLSNMDAVSAGGFSTQPQAIAAAESLLDLMDNVTTWSDNNYRNLSASSVDTGAGYQALLLAVSLAAGELIRASFDLAQERRIVLTRDRSVFDVVGQYYGEIDGRLDFFIESNDLSGAEILELPRGKTVLIYG